MKLGAKVAIGVGVALAAAAGLAAAVGGAARAGWPFGTVSGTVRDSDGELRVWNLVRLGDSWSAPWSVEGLGDPIEGPGGGEPGSGATRAIEGLLQHVERGGYSNLQIENGTFWGTDDVRWAVEEGPQGWVWSLEYPPGAQDEPVQGAPQADLMAAVQDLDRYSSAQGWGI